VTTLLIGGITFEGCHGTTSAERELAWRFEVDVELDAELSAAERTDRLPETIDYSAVAGTITEVGTSRTFHLLETLARALLDGIVERFPSVTAARIEVRKLAPPRCPGRPKYAGVRLSHP